MTAPLPPLGPYRLTNPIGRGAMGSVWAAVHQPTGQPVAVKVLGSAEASTSQREALRREVRAIGRLDHPHVVMVFDHGLVPSPAPPGLVAGTSWLAMELAETDLLRRKPTTWRGIRSVLLDVLSGLAHVHARGLVHRDLKPENVLAVQDAWKLADLGIAHALSGDGDGTSARAAGSPAYMAPEQLRGDLARQGPATDLYAVGCLAWELATGLPPFVRPTVTEVVRAHLHEAPPPFSGGPAPEGFGAWLAALLIKDPDRRTGFAADAADALRALPDVASTTFEVVGRASITTWSTVTADTWDAEAPDDPTQEHTALPPAAVPTDWRAGAGRASLRPRHGAELALAGLRRPPLFGREAAQDLLWAALRDTHATGRAALVRVTGPRGAGRTALLRWLAERAVETGAAVPCLRTRGGGDPLPPPDHPADRPTLLLLDDALSDPDGLALAQLVLRARAVVPRPWLVVATESTEALVDPGAASDFDALRSAAGTACAELALGPLCDEDLEALVLSLVHLTDATALNLVRLAGGWPRALVDLVGALVRAEAIAPGPDGYHVASPDALDAAVGLTRTALDRADALLAGHHPDEAHALEICAAVRVPLADATWRGLFASAGLAVGDDLGDRLLDHGLAEGEAARWGLVRGPLGAAIERRARAAGRWATACTAAARHLGDQPNLEHHVGRMWFDAGAFEASLRPLASDRIQVETCGDVMQSLTLREQALRNLGVPASDPRWADQLERECRSLHTRGALDACARAAERLLDEARHHGWRASEGTALGLLGALETLRGADGVARARESWEVLDQHGTHVQRSNARLNLISALTHGDRCHEALAMADAWLPELAGGSHTHGVVLRKRATALLFLGRPGDAEASAHEALAMDTAAGRWNAVGFAAQILGAIALDREDPEAGLRWHELALAHHLRLGNLYGARNALLNAAECHLRLGALDSAASLAAQGADLSPSSFGDVEPDLMAVEVALRRGDRDAARRRLPDPDGYSRSSRLELLLRDLALRGWTAVPHEPTWRQVHDQLVTRATALAYVPSQIPAALDLTARAWLAADRPDLAAEVASVALPHLDRHAPERASDLRDALRLD